MVGVSFLHLRMQSKEFNLYKQKRIALQLNIDFLQYFNMFDYLAHALHFQQHLSLTTVYTNVTISINDKNDIPTKSPSQEPTLEKKSSVV